MNCWELLQIEPTTNEKDIKRAYAKRLKSIDQMSEMDLFMALRTAYETALSYAANASYYEEIDEDWHSEHFAHSVDEFEHGQEKERNANIRENEQWVANEGDPKEHEHEDESELEHAETNPSAYMWTEYLTQASWLFSNKRHLLSVEHWQQLLRNPVFYNLEFSLDAQLIILRWVIEAPYVPCEILGMLFQEIGQSQLFIEDILKADAFYSRETELEYLLNQLYKKMKATFVPPWEAHYESLSEDEFEVYLETLQQTYNTADFDSERIRDRILWMIKTVPTCSYALFVRAKHASYHDRANFEQKFQDVLTYMGDSKEIHYYAAELSLSQTDKKYMDQLLEQLWKREGKSHSSYYAIRLYRALKNRTSIDINRLNSVIEFDTADYWTKRLYILIYKQLIESHKNDVNDKSIIEMLHLMPDLRCIAPDLEAIPNAQEIKAEKFFSVVVISLLIGAIVLVAWLVSIFLGVAGFIFTVIIIFWGLVQWSKKTS